MPTYEYKCEACGNTFEQFQSITAAPIKKCPKCGKLKVKRLISAGAGLLFKGSGFYITDYRNESYDKAAKADSSSQSNASDSNSADTKPAETKATDSKPAEAKPAETKPAETKSSESKPAEAGSRAASKSQARSAPPARKSPKTGK